MSKEHLVAVVTPPLHPVEAGPITLRSPLEARLGLSLPHELYEVGATYGSGKFGNQIEVLNPFSSSYFDTVVEVCDLYRDLRRDEGTTVVPYDVYPVHPGLFPWGLEENGHMLFWLTEGKQESWPILLARSREARFERWDMPMTTFLSKVFKGEIHCILWDNDTQRQFLGIRFQPKAFVVEKQGP